MRRCDGLISLLAKLVVHNIFLRVPNCIIVYEISIGFSIIITFFLHCGPFYYFSSDWTPRALVLC